METQKKKDESGKKKVISWIIWTLFGLLALASATITVTDSNIFAAGSNVTAQNASFGGTVVANTFIGDGSRLTNVVITLPNASLLQNGLILWLGFDENGLQTNLSKTYDSSILNNKTTVYFRNGSSLCFANNTQCPSYESGFSLAAARFNGDASNVIAINTNNNLYNNTNLSVSVWFKVVGLGDSSSHIFSTSGSGTPGNRIRAFFNGSGESGQTVSIQAGAATITNTSVENTITNNIWYHMALTYDFNNTLRAYINGRLVGSNSSAFSGTVNQFIIGDGDVTSTDTINGTIDEFKLFNRELAATEIQALANGFGGTPTGHLVVK